MLYNSWFKEVVGCIMKSNIIPQVKKKFKDNLLLSILIVLWILSAIFIDGFSSKYNLTKYMASVFPLLVAACGVTFAVLNAGIDFSSSAIITLTSVLGAWIMISSKIGGTAAGILVGILVCLCIGAITGAFNGASVVFLKMPSFIVTLVTQLLLNGFAVWFASRFYERTSLNGFPASFLELGGNGTLGLYPPGFVALIALGFAYWLLEYTHFGRKVFSVGTNPRTSFISGIRHKQTIFLMMFISGIYAAISGILYTAKNAAGMPALGDNLFIDIIASIIIGGTSILGGEGGVKQTLFGVLLIVWIDNAMTLYGLSWYIIFIIKGVLVIIIATIDILSKTSRSAKIKHRLV